MVEHFGKANRARETLRRFRPSPANCSELPHCDMRANAGIVTAEGVAEMTVAGHIVELDAVPAIVHRIRHIAAEKSGRPSAMIGFQQQFAVAGILRKRHQFPRPVARQRRLALDIGIDPQAPFGLK